jgi:hypothetical protein
MDSLMISFDRKWQRIENDAIWTGVATSCYALSLRDIQSPTIRHAGLTYIVHVTGRETPKKHEKASFGHVRLTKVAAFASKQVPGRREETARREQARAEFQYVTFACALITLFMVQPRGVLGSGYKNTYGLCRVCEAHGEGMSLFQTSRCCGM